MNIKPKHVAEVLETLNQEKPSLSNVDFENLGSSFEAFLRYAQLSQAGLDKFHSGVRAYLESIAS